MGLSGGRPRSGRQPSGCERGHFPALAARRERCGAVCAARAAALTRLARAAGGGCDARQRRAPAAPHGGRGARPGARLLTHVKASGCVNMPTCAVAMSLVLRVKGEEPWQAMIF